MKHQATHPHAIHALRAAKYWRQWGRFAAIQYCRKRGVPLSLLTLARVLEAGAQHDHA